MFSVAAAGNTLKRWGIDVPSPTIYKCSPARDLYARTSRKRSQGAATNHPSVKSKSSYLSHPQNQEHEVSQIGIVDDFDVELWAQLKHRSKFH